MQSVCHGAMSALYQAMTHGPSAVRTSSSTVFVPHPLFMSSKQPPISKLLHASYSSTICCLVCRNGINCQGPIHALECLPRTQRNSGQGFAVSLLRRSHPYFLVLTDRVNRRKTICAADKVKKTTNAILAQGQTSMRNFSAAIGGTHSGPPVACCSCWGKAYRSVPASLPRRPRAVE
jgi:hypothetical protein